ncbi:galactokinase [Bdellovibrionota bacterium FG-2]
MIIARSPLRISLGGGGTDLPSYYREHGGFLVAAAIDKYVYVTFQRTFAQEMLLRYSQIEHVTQTCKIKHPIIREALKLMEIDQPNIEITSMADIPAGTGLGSSGSFGTALLKAVHKFKNSHITPKELAEMACHIEIDVLKEPVGKQDQFIAAFGGLSVFEFHKDDTVHVRPLRISDETLSRLEDNLLLFSTGIIRSASEILSDQHQKSLKKNAQMIENLHFIKELGLQSCKALEDGRLEDFGRIMNEHWEHKKRRSSSISNSEINNWYDLGMSGGACGGKLIGAGGGGFLMFYTEDPARLRKTMNQAGLMELRFSLDFEGTKLL